VFFGLYPILRHPIQLASGVQDIYDLMGKDAVVVTNNSDRQRLIGSYGLTANGMIMQELHGQGSGTDRLSHHLRAVAEVVTKAWLSRRLAL